SVSLASFCAAALLPPPPTRRSSDLAHLVAVPNGVTLQNVEAQLAGRTRFRGKLTTSSIPDFVGYVKARADGHGFIDTENLGATRSEEHTSELQSREKLVCRLLLEKT